MKKFKDIVIRPLKQSDIARADEFKNFINELVDDKDAFIATGNKKTLTEEREYFKSIISKIKKQEQVYLLAEKSGKLVGSSSVDLKTERQNHIAELGITILKDYRGIGLGAYLMKEILKLAKKELKPKPKIIRLGVFANNKIAISLYEKMGFKIVAKIPKQLNFHGKLIDEIVMILEL
ncbi:MAG: GNAT family N-acetyltransferase [bacterium]